MLVDSLQVRSHLVNHVVQQLFHKVTTTGSHSTVDLGASRGTVSLTSPMGKLWQTAGLRCNTLQFICVCSWCKRMEKHNENLWKSPWGLRLILQWNVKTGPVWPNQIEHLASKTWETKGNVPGKRRGCCRHLQRCAEHDLPPAARLFPSGWTAVGRRPITQNRGIQAHDP